MVKGISTSKDIEVLTTGIGQELTVTRTRKLTLAVMPITPFGKYNLVGKLGHGSMAEVFLAYVAGPAGFRKMVVIKRLHEQLEEDPRLVGMFLDEARLAARLSHQNIVQCFEVGEAEGRHFIAMEYLEGNGLDSIGRQCIRRGRKMPERMTVRILCDALEGLNNAHNLQDFDGTALEIVHRGVSPQNLFVTYDGLVKVLDFGMAKASSQLVETRAGAIKGKYGYMAPEQVRGRAVDGRTDLWAMGVVLWETLSGRRLFKGESEIARINQALTAPIPPLNELVPELPPQLIDVVERALPRDPQERFQSAREMRLALEQSVEGLGGVSKRSEVSEFVKEIFAEEMDQHRRVLRVCMSDSWSGADQFRAPSHTPPDLRLTPSQGFESSALEVLRGEDALAPARSLHSPSREGDDTKKTSSGRRSLSDAEKNAPEVKLAPPPREGLWSRLWVLVVALVLAVLSSLTVLWLWGPQG